MIALIVEAAVRSLALGAAVWRALVGVRPHNPHLHKTVWSTVLLAPAAIAGRRLKLAKRRAHHG
jgi:hypothetical protein